MINLATHLRNWTDQKSLIGYDSNDFYELVQLYIKQVNSFNDPLKIKVILAEKDLDKFLAAFLACIITKTPVFLGNHDWKAIEWQQVFELVQPDLILGFNQDFWVTNTPIKKSLTMQDEYLIKNKIMIPTGGTSGKIQFAIHTWQSLTASVKGFQQYFELEKINSFCLLPLYHVSGLMQFLRSFLTLGKLVVLSYSNFKNNPTLIFEYQSFFISLVPKQLQFILDNYSDWLAQFQAVLLGGSPAWLDLLERARKKKIKLALTYGMTETASQIVTLKPNDFLLKNNTVGQLLPHAQIIIQNEQGKVLQVNETGIITIKATSLFLGYYPDLKNSDIFQTDDLGFFDNHGYLNIIGRNSQKIITGGENVFPIEVESVILATQLVKDVVVIGLPDAEWGEVLTAIYSPNPNIYNFNLESLQNILRAKLSVYKCPKYWLSIEEIPRTNLGKIDYKYLKEYAQIEKLGSRFL